MVLNYTKERAEQDALKEQVRAKLQAELASKESADEANPMKFPGLFSSVSRVGGLHIDNLIEEETEAKPMMLEFSTFAPHKKT
jgi:hypothetical protein